MYKEKDKIIALTRKKFPELNDNVMVQVTKQIDGGVFCKLLEYVDIEGFINLSQTSQRIKLIPVRKIMAARVIRISNGYIDLSMKHISSDERLICEHKYKNICQIYSYFPEESVGEAFDKVINKLEDPYKELNEEVIIPGTIENRYNFTDKTVLDIIEFLRKKFIPKELTAYVNIFVNHYGRGGIDSIKEALMEGKINGVNIRSTTDGSFRVSARGEHPVKLTEKVNDSIERIITKINEIGGSYTIKRDMKID